MALREIINAAAEGRLLLPSDGAIVLLDCGIGIASMIVNNDDKCNERQTPVVCDAIAEQLSPASPPSVADDDDQSKTLALMPSSVSPPTIVVSDCDAETIAQTKFEPKYSEFETPELSKYDYIYEFLCCAKCMNDESSRHSHADCRRVAESMAAHNETVSAMQSTARQPELTAIDCETTVVESCENNVINHSAFDGRRHRHHAKPHATNCQTKLERNGFLPIYATIKQKMQQNGASRSTTATADDHIVEPSELSVIDEAVSRSFAVTADIHSLPSATTAAVDEESPPAADASHEVSIQMPSSKSSSRKTSVDSSCTVGSMDSGFIEMQNKQIEVAASTTTDTNNKEKSPNETDAVAAVCQRDTENASLKECSTQSSRNRRKSYEEFKAIFHNRNASVEPDLPLVQENATSLPTFGQSQKDKIQARRKSYEEFKALVREHYDGDASRFKRKNSKRMSWSKQKASKESMMATTKESVAEESVASQAIVPSKPSAVASKEEIYKKNCKIYDKLISYGTIYDIMQKKTDIYYKVYRKYDAYMTYGTIYEILQRKSDDYEIFRRSRAASEKYTNKRVSIGDAKKILDDDVDAGDGERPPNFGTIYDIVQRKQSVAAKKSQSLPNGIIGAIEMAKLVDAEKRKAKLARGKIYDIIQTESTETDVKTDNSNVINRFLVKKVNETDLTVTSTTKGDASKVDDAKTHMYSEPASCPTKLPGSVPKKAKKSNRMRRFSHILSYTHRHNGHQSSDNSAKSPSTTIEPMPSAIEEDDCPSETQTTLTNEHTVHQCDEDIYTPPKNRSKCRKLSSLAIAVEQPPKIAPRKQSIAPPPIPTSPSSQATKHASITSSNDVIVATTSASIAKADNAAGTNGPIDTESLSQNLIAATNTASTTITTTPTATTTSSHESQSMTLVTTTTSSPTTGKSLPLDRVPHKKTKSRRLSEFTRGEFLNEKS